MLTCNTALEDAYIEEEPLLANGLTWHTLGLWLSAGFGAFSLLVSLLLILAHCTHYSKPWEQRHIIRILLMIPIYATVSFLSFLYYRHTLYFQVIRDCYEAFAIASFFTLLCHYIAPTLHEQKEYFRTTKPKNWFWQVFGLQYITGGKNRGLLRIPRSGLTWFNVIWISIFQYCIVRVLATIASLLTQHWDLYCEESLSYEFAHVWIAGAEALSVTVAMFCLIQFYIQLKTELAPYRPFLKVLCIKLVIFFSFWQTLVISFLSSSRGPLHPTARLAYGDIRIGISSTLLCIEMAIFSVMHVFAFPWQSYMVDRRGDDQKAEYTIPTSPRNPPGRSNDPQRSLRYYGGFLGLGALLDAFNPWDIVKATARGFRWLFVGSRRRKEDASYRTAASKPGRGSTATDRTQVTISSPIPLYDQVSQNDFSNPRPLRASQKSRRSADDIGLLAHQSSSPPSTAAPLREQDEFSDVELMPPITNYRAQHLSTPQSSSYSSQQYPSHDDGRWQISMSPSGPYHSEGSAHPTPRTDSFATQAHHPGAIKPATATAISPGIGIAVTGDTSEWLAHKTSSLTSQARLPSSIEGQRHAPPPPPPFTPPALKHHNIAIDPAKQAQRQQRRREQFEKQELALSRSSSRGARSERSHSRPRSQSQSQSQSQSRAAKTTATVAAVPTAGLTTAAGGRRE